MFCCLTASTGRALLCMASVEFRIQMMVEAVLAYPDLEHCHLASPDLEHCHLFPSGEKRVGVSLVPWMLKPPLAVLFGF